MIDEPRRTDHCSVPGWRADPAIDHVSNAELGGSLVQHVVLNGMPHQFGRQGFGGGLVEPKVSEKHSLGFPSRVRRAEQVAHDLVDRNRSEVGFGEFHERNQMGPQ